MIYQKTALWNMTELLRLEAEHKSIPGNAQQVGGADCCSKVDGIVMVRTAIATRRFLS